MAAKDKAKDKAKAKKPTRMELLAAAIAACKDAKGRVTPKRVVLAAKNPNNFLHDEFQWDVAKAAQREWERTASSLIREVKFMIQYEDTELAVPFYVSDPRVDEGGYIPVMKIAKSHSLSHQMLRDELQRVKQAIRRAMGLAAAVNLVTEFERMLNEVVEIESSLSKS